MVSDPTIGRPMINIGRVSNSAAASAVLHLCQSVSSGTYIGIYSSQPADYGNGKLNSVQGALNNCMT